MRVECMKGHGTSWRLAVVAVLAGALLASPVAVCADVASDRAAAIVIFPKILVDVSSGLDTMIRLSNTSLEAQNVSCYYVNVTPHCENGAPGDTCFPDPLDCGGQCVAQWQETDFQIRLTARQPTAWPVSEGARDCQYEAGSCSGNVSLTCTRDADCAGAGRCVYPPCFRLDGFFRKGYRDQTNEGSRIPPAPEEPFVGELKCIAVDESTAPIGNNVLIGEALIGRGTPDGSVADIASYSAIGIPALDGEGNRDSTLVLGGPRGASNGQPCTSSTQCASPLECINRVCDNTCRWDDSCAEYEGCPNILILNHFFDGAVDPLMDPNMAVRVGTDLTLIPCTQDFQTQNPALSRTVAQFLVFNEFEQRFSTSRTVEGFQEFRISNLDTAQNERSIFSAGVAGTLSGQTRIRGVVDGADDHGNTLLGIAEEFRCLGGGYTCGFVSPAELLSSSATNLHFQGTRPERDFLYLGQ
jgi:hypothetical protein